MYLHFLAYCFSITGAVLCVIYSVTGTPTDLAVVRSGCNEVEISWFPPVHNVPPVSGYAVFYILTGSNTTQNGGNVNGTTANLVLSNLFQQGSTYEFFVVAYSNESNTLPSAHSDCSVVLFSEFHCSIFKPYDICY